MVSGSIQYIWRISDFRFQVVAACFSLPWDATWRKQVDLAMPIPPLHLNLLFPPPKAPHDIMHYHNRIRFTVTGQVSQYTCSKSILHQRNTPSPASKLPPYYYIGDPFNTVTRSRWEIKGRCHPGRNPFRAKQHRRTQIGQTPSIGSTYCRTKVCKMLDFR